MMYSIETTTPRNAFGDKWVDISKYNELEIPHTFKKLNNL